jgi:hypothetical protein
MFPWKNFDKLTYPALERKPNTEQNHLYSQKKEYKRLVGPLSNFIIKNL